MAHFANIQNGKVATVIRIDDGDCGGGTYPASEPVGQAFIASLGLPGLWVQTSYNETFGVYFAGVGFDYDADTHEFRPPQPYPSWTIVAGRWTPPTPYPDDGNQYAWDEDGQEWVYVGPA